MKRFLDWLWACRTFTVSVGAVFVFGVPILPLFNITVEREK